MAWSSVLTHMDFVGSLKRHIYTFDSAGVSTGSIVTGLTRVVTVVVIDKTGTRAGTSIDTTTTVGTVTVAGLTSNDVGWVIVEGL